MLKHKYIFQIKYSEAILSNSARKLLRFRITKMLIAVLKNKLIASFVIIFGTLSFSRAENEQLTLEQLSPTPFAPATRRQVHTDRLRRSYSLSRHAVGGVRRPLIRQ